MKGLVLHSVVLFTGIGAALCAGGAEVAMPARESIVQKTLISVEENLQVAEWSLSWKEVRLPGGGDAKWSIQKSVLHGGKQEGVDVVVVDNGRLKVWIIPT